MEFIILVPNVWATNSLFQECLQSTSPGSEEFGFKPAKHFFRRQTRNLSFTEKQNPQKSVSFGGNIQNWKYTFFLFERGTFWGNSHMKQTILVLKIKEGGGGGVLFSSCDKWGSVRNSIFFQFYYRRKKNFSCFHTAKTGQLPFKPIDLLAWYLLS